MLPSLRSRGAAALSMALGLMGSNGPDFSQKNRAKAHSKRLGVARPAGSKMAKKIAKGTLTLGHPK